MRTQGQELTGKECKQGSVTSKYGPEWGVAEVKTAEASRCPLMGKHRVQKTDKKGSQFKRGWIPEEGFAGSKPGSYIFLSL